MNIYKQLSDGSVSNENFEFSLYLGSDEKKLYEGAYQIRSAADNSLISTITAEENEGIIYIKAGQYAKITGLTGGNTVKVVEDTSKLSSDIYLEPTYKIEGALDLSKQKVESGYAEATALEGKLLNKGSVNVYVTNNKKVTSLTVSKEVIGNMADLNKEFTFTVSDTNEVLETFTLKDGEKKVINNLPVDTTVTITENTDGYTLDQVNQGTKIFSDDEITVDSGNDNLVSVTITLAASNDVVVFTNKKEVIIDTGISMDTLPYILIMLAVIGGIAFTIIRRRKDDELD